MGIETTQVRIKLTNDREVLAALRKRKQFKRDAQGEYIELQFDAQAFKFRPGMTVTVGESVANALRRSSGVIVGDDLTGDIQPALVEDARHTLGETPKKEQRSRTACPVCDKECYNLITLSRHVRIAHKADRPDLYNAKPPIQRPKTNWDIDLEEEERKMKEEEAAEENMTAEELAEMERSEVEETDEEAVKAAE